MINLRGGIVVALVALAWIAAARAHDRSRPDLDEWFNKLASGRGLCCSATDGTALSDVDWEAKDGRYRVRIDGQWIDVPDDALITVPNRVGRTMVWPIRYPEAGKMTIVIRCFMPGAMI